MLGRRSRVDQSVVWVPSQVADELEQEAERCDPLETGGVLLGFPDANDHRQVQVAALVGPGPHATHRRHRFDPDTTWQRERIAATYRRSGHVVTYLGDWHSHPRGSGTPSRLDRKTARRIARFPGARAPHPLMLIVSGGPESWSIDIYRYSKRKLRVAECRLVDDHGA